MDSMHEYFCWLQRCLWVHWALMPHAFRTAVIPYPWKAVIQEAFTVQCDFSQSFERKDVSALLWDLAAHLISVCYSKYLALLWQPVNQPGHVEMEILTKWRSIDHFEQPEFWTYSLWVFWTLTIFWHFEHQAHLVPPPKLNYSHQSNIAGLVSTGTTHKIDIDM